MTYPIVKVYVKPYAGKESAGYVYSMRHLAAKKDVVSETAKDTHPRLELKAVAAAMANLKKPSYIEVHGTLATEFNNVKTAYKTGNMLGCHNNDLWIPLLQKCKDGKHKLCYAAEESEYDVAASNELKKLAKQLHHNSKKETARE